MAIVKAPGTVTVGVDSKGKHYKYESGKGRGRQPLNLSPGQAQALAAKGLRPGHNVNLSPAEAAGLGSGGAPATGGAPNVGNASPYGPNVTNPDIGARKSAIVESHRRSFQRGEFKTAESALGRLARVVSTKNLAWLENAGPKPTGDQKAFAAAILGTIFNKNLGSGAQGVGDTKNKAGKELVQVQFNPGGNGKHGHISLVDKDGKNRGSVAFKSLHDLSVDNIKQLRDEYTAAKFDHDRPKPGAHHELYATAERLIDATGLTEKNRAQYKQHMRHVLNRIPDESAKRIKNNIKHAFFHDTVDQIDEHIRSVDKTIDKRFGPNVKARGGYLPSTGDIVLNGGDAGVYAHELGHAIDGKGEFSKTADWGKAHESEAHRVSEYARRTPAESFAEFSRLLYSGDNHREKIQAETPRMYSFFERNKLLPDHFNSRDNGRAAKMREIFDTPIVTDGVVADGNKLRTKPDSKSTAQESALNAAGKRIYERPSKTGESDYQVYNTKTRRFEGERHKSRGEAIAGSSGNKQTTPAHQQKALDDFTGHVAKHEPHLTENKAK